MIMEIVRGACGGRVRRARHGGRGTAGAARRARHGGRGTAGATRGSSDF
jgi:hypothetical protein